MRIFDHYLLILFCCKTFKQKMYVVRTFNYHRIETVLNGFSKSIEYYWFPSWNCLLHALQIDGIFKTLPQMVGRLVGQSIKLIRLPCCRVAS